MITKSLFKSFMLCLLVTQFIACTKEAANPPASLPLTASSVAGNFTVSSFTSTDDQTAAFSGFTFVFNENGTIIATKGSNTFNGTWNFDDSDHTEFKLHFADAPLSELNKGWHIAELTSDHLLLTDDSGDDDANDDHPSGNVKLEFERH